MADVLPFPTADEPVELCQTRSDRSTGDSSGAVEPKLRDLIGDVLREERLDQDRTLADVADDAHVSLPYLSEVERGRKEVSSDLLDAICDSLELPLVDLLERATDRLRIVEVERLRAGAGVDARPQRGPRLQLLAA
jgi:transcriptional regulator with XRE-family HTH domain